MRIAVISDVHANFDALQQALAQIDAAGADELWCLGDLVGYGRRPAETVALVRDRCDLVLAGNHDLACAGRESLNAFPVWFRGQLVRARDELDTAGLLGWLTGLEPQASSDDGISAFHGAPWDSAWGTTDDPGDVRRALAEAAGQLILVGHTHAAYAYLVTSSGLDGGYLAGERTVPLRSSRALLNPGTLGCRGRGSDPRGSWLLVDLDRREARFHRLAG